MRKLVGRVDLRNLHHVYREDEAYIVASENSRGRRYECRIPPEAVSLPLPQAPRTARHRRTSRQGHSTRR